MPATNADRIVDLVYASTIDAISNTDFLLRGYKPRKYRMEWSEIKYTSLTTFYVLNYFILALLFALPVLLVVWFLK